MITKEEKAAIHEWNKWFIVNKDKLTKDSLGLAVGFLVKQGIPGNRAYMLVFGEKTNLRF